MLVRRSLGMLCSETDGLPKKYRIVFKPDGLVREEQTEDIIHFAYDYYWCPLNHLVCSKKTKGRFPFWDSDLFRYFVLAKELYNDEQKYTFYRTADVRPTTFFT